MKKGFTGIEIMIVISIISLISAIALPKYINIISESKIANVRGNLSNLNTAISFYKLKNGVYPDLVGNEDNLGDFSEVYSKNKMPYTPPYSGGSKSNFVYSSRSNKGGWVYIKSDGVIYANLEDGIYSKNPSGEIWKEESSAKNSITYGFDNFDELIFKSDIWKISEDGTLYTTGGWNGYVFAENPYSEYVIDITARLVDLANGYGVFIQSDEEGAGYILQFDYGLKSIVTKERDSSGKELSTTFIARNEDYMTNEWWTSEHNISAEVTRNNDGTNSVSVSIDNEDITAGKEIIIDKSTATINYTGFRSWGNADVEVESLNIKEI